jgi:N-acetylglucosamine-6-phosphate deacetylase
MTSGAERNSNTHYFSGKMWKHGKFIPTEFSIENGRIKAGQKGIRTQTAFIVPPFADTHIHGGWGKSFLQGDFTALENHLKSIGVLFAVPTLNNNEIPELKKIAQAFTQYQQENPDTIFPFLRVEGPFISHEQKGFQREDCIQAATEENIHDFLSIPEIKIFTFAPEMEGADTLVKEALKQNKLPSVGHSHAGYSDFLKLYRLGIRHLTHYPNAMSGLHHREIGLTGTGLLMDDLQLEVIADGIHNSYEFISLLLKIKGPTFSITSDLIPPAHSQLVEFEERKIIKQGKKFTTANGKLAGGGTTIPEQVKQLFKQGFTPEELIPLACLNTLKMLGRGSPSLEPGSEASFLLLNDQMELEAVYFKGKRLNKEGLWKVG